MEGGKKRARWLTRWEGERSETELENGEEELEEMLEGEEIGVEDGGGEERNGPSGAADDCEEPGGERAEKVGLEERVGGGEEIDGERGEGKKGGEESGIVVIEIEKGLVGEREGLGQIDSERKREKQSTTDS